jgi:hypothetical protein
MITYPIVGVLLEIDRVEQVTGGTSYLLCGGLIYISSFNKIFERAGDLF